MYVHPYLIIKSQCRGLDGNFPEWFFSPVRMGTWTLPQFRLEVADELPPKPRQVWSHQVVQRIIRCRQSKFLFRFSNLPLPASACRKVANRNPRRWRNLKKCVLKVSSSFLFFPFRSAQRRGYDLRFMIFATLTALKIWNQTAASDVWVGDFFSWWIR